MSYKITGQNYYTPTLYNGANVAASTAYQCIWTRIGPMVTVSGYVEIDPTSGSVATELGISLPIASNIAGVEGCVGVGGTGTISAESIQISGDAANDRASLSFIAGTTSNHAISFMFTYMII